MSNPAVIVLSSGKIGKSNVAIEDNVGEALHIHIDDIRIDYSYQEFKMLVEGTKQVIEDMISVQNFHCNDYDPVFLGSILPYLLDLERVEMCTIRLSEILVNQPKTYKHVNYEGIMSSIDYKALKNNQLNIGYNSFDHIGQSGNERLQLIVDSIKTHGYPFENKKLVFFNDCNVIRDGQHRAAVLFYLYGDMEVPIVRMYFKDDKYSYPNIYKKHIKSFKDRNYFLTYIKNRVMNISNKRKEKKVLRWKHNHKELIALFDLLDH